MLQSWEEVYFTKRRIVGCGTLISRGKANKGDFRQTSLFVTLIVMPSLEPVLAGRLLHLTRDHQEVACGLPHVRFADTELSPGSRGDSSNP
jgi:hypothetical protein